MGSLPTLRQNEEFTYFTDAMIDEDGMAHGIYERQQYDQVCIDCDTPCEYNIGPFFVTASRKLQLRKVFSLTNEHGYTNGALE